MLWEVEPHPKIDYQYTHDGSLLIPGLFAFYNSGLIFVHKSFVAADFNPSPNLVASHAQTCPARFVFSVKLPLFWCLICGLYPTFDPIRDFGQ